MAVSNAYKNQIQNRNFLSPVGFKFVVNRARKVSFFGNSMNIPGLTLGIANQPTYLKDIPLPGEKIDFSDLNLRFLVDENLENYMEIQRWIRGIGFPESLDEIYNFQEDNPSMDAQFKDQMNLYSDATLFILTSNNTANFQVKFRNIFPYNLTDLQFDATDSDIDYLTAEVSFKYTIYDIVDNSGNPLHYDT
jgi:hypothetical protein